MELELLTTGDESPTLYNSELNETYHSRHGARQESEHVYIASGLDELKHKSKIRVFEMGFGTGLNILLANNFAVRNDIHLDITTIELFPLEEKIWRKLDYSHTPEEKSTFIQLHEASWEEQLQVTPQILLHKRKMGLEELEYEKAFDILFFDAFGPDKQPHLWTPEVFSKLYKALDDNGVLVTYSAKGQVRRDLQSVGFNVERIPGPPGKREMLRAKRLERTS